MVYKKEMDRNSILRIFRHKKAWNDMTIAFPILFLFVALGIVMPYVNASFNQNVNSNNVNLIDQQLQTQTQAASSITTFTILFSVAKMFIWTFGSINAIIDALIFIPLRIMLALFLYRQIRSGAG